MVDYDEFGRDEFSFGNRPVTNGVDREGPVLSKLGSSSTAELHPKTGAHIDSKQTSMPPASVMTRLILIMVWRKLIRNPNTYSSLIGLTWSLVSFKYETLILELVLNQFQIVVPRFLIYDVILQVENRYASDNSGFDSHSFQCWSRNGHV